MTVARLQAEMSAYEFMQWTVIYGRENQRAEMARMRAKR